MANFPDYINATEARIINKILTRALQNGFHVAVNDGEELALKPTRNRADIQAEVAATEVTILILYTPSEKQEGKWKRHGNVVLIHGNGEDVLSDMSAPDNAALDRMEELFKGIE